MPRHDESNSFDEIEPLVSSVNYIFCFDMVEFHSRQIASNHTTNCTDERVCVRESPSPRFVADACFGARGAPLRGAGCNRLHGVEHKLCRPRSLGASAGDPGAGRPRGRWFSRAISSRETKSRSGGLPLGFL